MHVTTAKPQLGECVRCSYAGTSFSSQPSSWQWHEKHWTLSGLVVVGFQTNPAKAKSCAEGSANGQAFFDFAGAFLVLDDVRLDLEAGAVKVSIRAWSDAREAAMACGSGRPGSSTRDCGVESRSDRCRCRRVACAVLELDCGEC
jgi:hypothetical protein